MIHLYALTKKFRNKKEQTTAIDSLNFEIKKGEIFGLLGQNGAGKTTTVKVLSTLITPNSGTAIVNGYDITKECRAVRASIGISVGDERSFYFRLSGYQNLEFFGALYGLAGKFLRTKIEEVMTLLDLVELKELKFMKYSTGMKKRLNLARSLLCNPPIYFFDEPTSSIDPLSAVKIRNLIKNLRDIGKTILLTSHNMFEVGELCDRIAILDKGKILVIATPYELKRRMKNFTVRIKLNGPVASQFKAKILQLAFVEQITTEENSWFSINTSDKSGFLYSMYQIASEYSLKISDLEIKDPSLEDIFITMTGDRKNV